MNMVRITRRGVGPHLARVLVFLTLTYYWGRALGQDTTKNIKGESERGVIRICGVGTHGTSSLLGVLAKLEEEYRKSHPEVSFIHHLNGNDSALGGIYTGIADLALMDRDPSYIELDGYQQVISGQKPYVAPLMRGGIAIRGHSSPLVVIVNRQNPIATLSTAQLEAIFSVKNPGTSRQIYSWGDLGLATNWSALPLHLYGFGIETSEARTFSKLVLGDSRRWPTSYRELEDTSSETAEQRVVEIVAEDTGAIGVTTFDAITDDVKILAIEDPDKIAVKPTSESLATGQYLLGRTIFALVKAQKDGSIDANVHNFLAYLLSAQAQPIIAEDGAYISLKGSLIDSERKTLQ